MEFCWSSVVNHLWLDCRCPCSRSSCSPNVSDNRQSQIGPAEPFSLWRFVNRHCQGQWISFAPNVHNRYSKQWILFWTCSEVPIMDIFLKLKFDFKVQHLFCIQNQKRNQGTLIENGRNRPVSRNQTAILAGTLKSILKVYWAWKSRGYPGYQSSFAPPYGVRVPSESKILPCMYT